MNKRELLDIYSDYLVSAFGPTTGTGLAELLKGSISLSGWLRNMS